MKASHYNFFFPLESGEFIAFNALKNGMAVVDKGLVESIGKLKAGENVDFDDQTTSHLRKGGFICAEDCDEYRLLMVRKNMQQYGGGALGLTILPTLDCSLACQYCYEVQDPHVMDEKTARGILDFINHSIEGGTKRVSITWFGGEPLLCLDIIEKLSGKIIETCDKQKVAYSAYIITNGVLFDRPAAEKLKSLKVRGAQITIDGPKEVHDRRRPFKNKDAADGSTGSFDTIWKNLQDTAGILPVSLRINVDKSNVDQILGFLEKMREHEWFQTHFGASIRPHYGHVKKYTASCRCSKEETLKPGDFWKKELELYKYLGKCGYGFQHYPDLSFGCSATSINSYVIGPKGKLYKCWNHAGDSACVVGSIFEPIELNPFHITYLTETFENDPQCRHCRFLPICMGGCVDIRVKALQGEMETKNCAGWKYYLEESLREYLAAKMVS